MPTVIKLKIDVDEIANVLDTWDRIQVHRSITGIEGVYVEITTVATRVALQQGASKYEFDDQLGEITYWYKTRFSDSSGANAESNFSEPSLGDDLATDLILTKQQLLDRYLFGLDLTDDAGNPFPDETFDHAIRWAIAHVERELDIRIRPTDFVERYDYYLRDYQTWTFIELREAPALLVRSVKVKWPSDSTVIDFPKEWIQLRKDSGQVNIVPTSGTLSQVLLTAGGSFLPLVASGRDFVPDIIEIDYQAGFALGEVPREIKDVIGKYAAFGPLNIAGDLIVGAGIASKTISIDGLSQSINTTSSATNAGYGARLGQYAKELKLVMPNLRRYYKGISLTALG